MTECQHPMEAAIIADANGSLDCRLCGKRLITCELGYIVISPHREFAKMTAEARRLSQRLKDMATTLTDDYEEYLNSGEAGDDIEKLDDILDRVDSILSDIDDSAYNWREESEDEEESEEDSDFDTDSSEDVSDN